MSKEIRMSRYVCLNCDTPYDTREEAETCIKEHDFPKKLWLNSLALEKDNFDNYLEKITERVLGFRKVTWRSDEGCPVERFVDSFAMDFLIEVDGDGHVKILEIHPLQGLGYREFYKPVVTKEND